MFYPKTGSLSCLGKLGKLMCPTGHRSLIVGPRPLEDKPSGPVTLACCVSHLQRARDPAGKTRRTILRKTPCGLPRNSFQPVAVRARAPALRTVGGKALGFGAPRANHRTSRGQQWICSPDSCSRKSRQYALCGYITVFHM